MKIFTILPLLLSLQACVSDYEEERDRRLKEDRLNHESRMIQEREAFEEIKAECRANNSDACMAIAIEAAKDGVWWAAEKAAKKACKLGHDGGCRMIQDMPELKQDLRDMRRARDERAREQVRDDRALIQLFQQSANQIGTITVPPTPRQTDCYETYGDFGRKVIRCEDR